RCPLSIMDIIDSRGSPSEQSQRTDTTQAQKTTHDFTRDRFRITPKDEYGTDAGDPIYAVEPRSYLVVGDQAELRGNDDKVACFELYRRNMRAPEIITFDELYERANCIVEQIDQEQPSSVT
ncbi:Shedu anti-phage system protein SduA domain-containing protein, partial [uncultured Jannaschia sp.]|uniref:Shedu anti-phage system protein SduA domain-containing protein n=1 Tax=uncultured Jannaschia sp. TaxID=293347 RepID=UPI00260EBD6E